jgi:hypothetical protein
MALTLRLRSVKQSALRAQEGKVYRKVHSVLLAEGA